MTFETKMETLETIIEKIEAPDTTLDDSLTLFKEGIALAKACGEILSTHEAEVMTLQKEAENLFTLTPFDYN